MTLGVTTGHDNHKGILSLVSLLPASGRGWGL